MRLGWGHDDGAFFFSRPDAAQQECCEPGFTLLCMGLFSRFFVQALPCTAEGTVCRVRDTRSLVPRAYGTNRSSSNTSCSSFRRVGKGAFRAVPTAAVAGVKVGTRSLSSGARSRDPLALPTYELNRIFFQPRQHVAG